METEDLKMLLRFETKAPEEFIGDLFQYAGRSARMQVGDSSGSQHSDCACPRVDVEEQTNKFLITAELPGVRKEDLTVRVEDGVLIVRGTRDLSPGEGTKIVLQERQAGGFFRSFRLPDVVDQSGIGAHLADGMLKLELPKAEHALAREIKVR
jgi:HSP20 family protein